MKHPVYFLSILEHWKYCRKADNFYSSNQNFRLVSYSPLSTTNE